jgi:DNA-binding NarL/FixJ family response regulator
MTRVLLADDHPMFREGLRFTLERAGMTVVAEAADGAEALSLVAETDPDVVVMDLAMPVLDGLAATQRLNASGCRARVLVLTMSEEDANVFAAVRAGATGYLVKGVAAAQVVSAVHALSAGHAVFGPGLATRMLDFFAGRPAEGRFPELSPREQEVLRHLAAGRSNQQIAAELVISPITVRNHVSSILTKLQVTNRREAMLRFHDRPGPQGGPADH